MKDIHCTNLARFIGVYRTPKEIFIVMEHCTRGSLQVIEYIYYWNLQFLYNVIINKTKVLLPRAVILANLPFLCRPFGLITPKTLYYLTFQSFDFERTWWRLFQKRDARTKFDIYAFINNSQIECVCCVVIDKEGKTELYEE